MVKLTAKGDFSKATQYLEKLKQIGKNSIFDKYGQMGVDALAAATPTDTGKTASSWSYKIQNSGNEVKIIWNNANVNKGVNIAMIIQYGHGTRNGGYVQGIDYINPVLKPVFEKFSQDLRREVTSL